MALDGYLKAAIAKAWYTGQRILRTKPSLTILYYHAVSPEWTVNFRQQMSILVEEAELVFADHVAPPLGKRPQVAVTFDDAFESVARNAVPVLADLGIPATVFAPTGWLGLEAGWATESKHDAQDRVMDAVTLRSIRSPLLRIASHSVSHPRMADIAYTDQLRQARDSRAFLEDLVQQTVDEFAFPYGSHNAEALAALKEAGYRVAYSVMPQSIGPEYTGLLRGRSAVEPSDPVDLFQLKMQGAFAWMPHASRVKHAVRRVVR